jgi:hypothetical protein
MNENTKWFSQTVLTHKDKFYGTDGYLRVSISTNTTDYKFYNPPVFNISITNNYQKSYNINISNAEDLLESFEKALKQLNGDNSVVEKKYQKDTKIYFKFALETSSQERVVIIELTSNESDTTKIIIPLKPTFQSMLRRLRKFVENYDTLCINLLNQSINNEQVQIIQQLPSLIKGISSQISIPDSILDSRAAEPAYDHEPKTESTIEDLDKFLGDDMSNIKIPEIEEDKVEKKETLVEYESPFIEKMLENDLTKLENKLNSFGTSRTAVLDLAEDIKTNINIDPLRGIDEEDKKSLAYLSTLFHNLYSKAYTINDTPIPISIPILKCKVADREENVEFAKDILMIIGYFRTLRRRMESKFENAYENKSMVYLFLRCFMDSYAFSYLDKLDENDITSSVVGRYKYFDSLGLFDKYKTLLNDNNCSSIDEGDIKTFIQELNEKVISGTKPIGDLHEALYLNGNVSLPSKNQFSLEQITNEAVLVEVDQKLGYDIKNSEIIGKLKEKGVSDEILNFFKGNKKVKKTSKAEKITPLQRYLTQFKQDIPESNREDVLKYVKELGNKAFDFSNCPWSLDELKEFDENVIKALYVWNPDIDKKMAVDYDYFAVLVDEENMTKDSILIVNENTEQQSGGFADMNFDLE